MAYYQEVEDGDEHSKEELLPEESHVGRVIYVKQRRSRWSIFRSWIGSFALGVISASIVFAGWAKVSELATRPRFKFANTDALADVPYESVMFTADAEYELRPSDDTDYQWNILLPPGRGFVYVPDSEARGLPRGQKVTHGEIYSVAMYHQLHCLARMRKMHWIYKDAITTGEMGMAKSVSGRTQSEHISHCLDYLRQSIMCNGDMTLEWPKFDGPSSGVKVDGWGIPHTCKSPVAIQDYMDKYRYNESLSFDAAG